MTVGVFDSGLGGLTVLFRIRERLPDLPIIYLGDNGNAPYGTRSPEEIYQMTCRGVQVLFEKGCKLVIIACNTASAVALRKMQEEWVPNDKRVLGVFVPLIEKITERQWGDNSPPRKVSIRDVALFATPSTVASKAFERELGFRSIGVNVESQPCDGLVDAIELGDLYLAEQLVELYVDQLVQRLPKPEIIVLGCTHYPLVSNFFHKHFEKGVQMLDHADIVAESLKDYLIRHPDKVGEIMDSICLTTGDPLYVKEKASMLAGIEVNFDKAD